MRPNLWHLHTELFICVVYLFSSPFLRFQRERSKSFYIRRHSIKASYVLDPQIYKPNIHFKYDNLSTRDGTNIISYDMRLYNFGDEPSYLNFSSRYLQRIRNLPKLTYIVWHVHCLKYYRRLLFHHEVNFNLNGEK